MQRGLLAADPALRPPGAADLRRRASSDAEGGRPQVAISVIGRFHAFDLAAQLERRGQLAQLITPQPRSRAARFGIDRARIDTVVSNEIAWRLWCLLPGWITRGADPLPRLFARFERRAAELLRECDLFVGWSGCNLAGHRRAHELGATTIVERGSSHMLTQCELLQEEYARHGIAVGMAHPGIVEKELAEYEEADYIAVPSAFVKRTFLERGVPESRLIHVPYGVSLDAFEPLPKRDDVFRVVHCGAVTLQKGCHYLLQAFHELALPDAELSFVGRVYPEMDPFRQKYASERVVFHGSQPQSELKHFYAQGSVFCLASIQEGLAMVVPQAMACGLPVVATTNTGADDLVREGVDGFIVPIRDVEALKGALLRLYEHPEEREAMGRSARQRVQQGFTWDDYGDRIAAEYARVLARGPQR